VPKGIRPSVFSGHRVPRLLDHLDVLWPRMERFQDAKLLDVGRPFGRPVRHVVRLVSERSGQGDRVALRRAFKRIGIVEQVDRRPVGRCDRAPLRNAVHHRLAVHDDDRRRRHDA
jgi:hypothetical protein